MLVHFIGCLRKTVTEISDNSERCFNLRETIMQAIYVAEPTAVEYGVRLIPFDP